jgi:hypothetical protein
MGQSELLGHFRQTEQVIYGDGLPPTLTSTLELELRKLSPHYSSVDNGTQGRLRESFICIDVGYGNSTRWSEFRVSDVAYRVPEPKF